MKVKEESEKVGLKPNIQKMKIMASGPITSWQIDGETMETMRDFILGGSKITADGDCSHEIKKHLLLGRKVMTNLNSILKSRDITLLTKVHLVKAMVFPVVMYGCESWTIKKAERRRIDAFEVWCWRRLLRVPWTARRSNQSILNEISREYSLEGLMLRLKLQHFGHLMRRYNSMEKTWGWERLKAGGEGDDRGWDSWMASPRRWTWVWASSKSWWCTGRPGMLQSLGSQSWTRLSDWTKWTDVFEDAGICAIWNYSLGMHLNRARIQSTECLLFLPIQKSLGLGLGALQWLMTPPLQNCCGGKHSLPAPIPYSYKRYFPTKILCLSYSWE